jgi:hypothetical protein
MMRCSFQALSVISWVWAGLAALTLVYFVTAPPIMMSIIKQHGFSSDAPGLWLYVPVVRVMESEFGGPLVWYFNKVWGAEVEFFGETSYGPVYAVLAYILAIALCVSLAAFPVWRRYWKRA